ncbi:MAG: biotin--[acetyl-CoA-carboxylase] ligase [Spirochaetales bacterium]|nr:biotin--[acetyl-CoA-carboxylase] ligase [Spirochaetales bacterium]
MVNPFSPGAEILYFDEVDSTMFEAKRLVQAKGGRGVSSGTVVRAGYQSSGRGRIAERQWLVSPGDGLLFTIIFTSVDLKIRMADKPFSVLSLLCGLAVSLSIEAFVPKSEVRIKWPNDILVDGKKICGMLCESSGGYCYAGIGINIKQKIFTEKLRRPACSLEMIIGKIIEPEVLLSSVLENMSLVLQSSSWKADIEERLYLKDEIIQMNVGLAEEKAVNNSIVEGRLVGIDPSGALSLETDKGFISILNGDLIIR